MAVAAKEKLLKDYIPKEATQQSEFLQKYPEYDGRGLLIAILDTGVDVSFDGMQKTTTGLPKVVDCFDFTEAGHVDTSCVKQIDSNNNNTIIGLSGRSLKIPSSWINPSGHWHLGIKSIYEMCSGAALESIIKKRKELICQQNEAVKQKIDGITKENGDKNYNAMIEYLKMTEDLSKDSLVADCIVWFNGEKWQACIDTTFIGDLESARVLTNFNDSHEYDKIWNILCYCIKIHDNGNLLDIITAPDAHGTYVSQVAAGCFPETPERNGLAPGAQIVSMTVLDSRNGDYLNNHALIKAAVQYIMQQTNAFRIYKIQIEEMTEKHGIIFIKALGNSGPIYSSVDRDDFLFQKTFQVGSVLTKKEGSHITYSIPYYSSRGPKLFGERGVCFVAPGDATIALPDYYPEKKSSFQGTSLAAPNAAGSIACLISALKATSIKYSPSIIKFALSKTALLPPNGDVLAYGYGIIQISAAFEFSKSPRFLKKYRNCNFQVKLINEDKNGIVLKLDGKDKKNKEDYSIEVLNKKRTDKVVLKLTPGTGKFVQYSDPQSHSFKVKLDTTKLEPGTINYAEISGYNSQNSLLGTTFHLPVTVIIPHKITKENDYRIQKEVTLKSEIPYRFFILPPEGSHQCMVKITSLDDISTHLLLHLAIEDLEGDTEKPKLLTFNKTNKIQTQYLRIYCDRQHEIALHLPSSTKRSGKFEVEIDFYGIYQHQCAADKGGIKNLTNNKAIKFKNCLETLTAALTLEFKKISYDLMPEIVCDETVKHVYDLNPTEYLKLRYTFTISKETKCCFKMNHYEKYPVLRAQVFTESKKFIHGFYTAYKETIALLPGKYSIIAYVFYSTSSENRDILPEIKELPFITLTMEFYKPFTLAINTKTKKNETKGICNNKFEFQNGEHQIHFGNIPAENMPAPLPQKVTFHGSLNFSTDNTQLNVPFEHKHTFRSLKENVVIKVEKENVKQRIYETQWPSLNDSTKLLSKKSKNSKEKKNALKETVNPLKFKENFELKLTDSFSTNDCRKLNKKVSDELDQKEKNNFSKAQNYVMKVYDHLLESVENKNIQKELTQIKHALGMKHFGTALLCLNKISTNHQTNPTFKFIDLAIIELLKHLKWEHLIEAHQHAILDRHRDYYRRL